MFLYIRGREWIIAGKYVFHSFMFVTSSKQRLCAWMLNTDLSKPLYSYSTFTNRLLYIFLLLTVRPKEVVEQLKEGETVPAVRRLNFKSSVHVSWIQAQERLGVFHHQVGPPGEGLQRQERWRKHGWVIKPRGRRWQKLDKLDKEKKSHCGSGDVYRA